MGMTLEPPTVVTPPPRTLLQQGNWLSEDPCYLIERDVYSRGSNNSSDKAEQSTENIAMKKSRVSSRENGERVCTVALSRRLQAPPAVLTHTYLTFDLALGSSKVIW